MNTYKYERCTNLEQVSALTASYAAQGLVPGGSPIKLGSGYGIAFVPDNAGRNKSFNTTRGWYTQNQLYSLGKIGIGMPEQAPKKRIVNQAAIDRKHKRIQLAHAKFCQDYADYLQSPHK